MSVKCASTVLVLSMTCILGCSTMQSPVQKMLEEETMTFRLTINSDPTGAKIFRTINDGKRCIGSTPLLFPFKFEKVPDPGFLGYFGRRIWQPIESDKSKSIISRRGGNFQIKLPELNIEKDGYETEILNTHWNIPVDMMVEVRKGLKVPVKTEKTETVVFRSPTKPLYVRTVEIESLSSPFEICALDPNGKPGEKIGVSPLSSRIGFAPVRSRLGEVVSWKRWDLDGHPIWLHNSSGELYLNACLVRDGFAPEQLSNFKVLGEQTKRDSKHTLVLELTSPTKAQAEYSLMVDSLPSGADVYLVKPDGSLGRKLSGTPFELVVGLAEKLRRDGDKYFHGEWLAWAPDGILQWANDDDGRSEAFIKCALYKEGFAVENIFKSIFTLTPGKPFPSNDTLTIPLLSPEQAAARETRQAAAIEKERDKQSLSTPQGRRVFIWQAPDEPQANPENKDNSENEEKKKTGLLRKIFRR
jgi:hypothetical protein